MTESGAPIICVEETTTIHFHDYEFSLSFVDADIELGRQMRTDRDAIMHSQGNFPSRHLYMFPYPNPEVVRNIWVHRELSRDRHSSVSSGVHHSGVRPVAIKRLSYKGKMRTLVARELRYRSILGGDLPGVLGLIDCWYEHPTDDEVSCLIELAVRNPLSDN